MRQHEKSGFFIVLFFIVCLLQKLAFALHRQYHQMRENFPRKRQEKPPLKSAGIFNPVGIFYKKSTNQISALFVEDFNAMDRIRALLQVFFVGQFIAINNIIRFYSFPSVSKKYRGESIDPA